MLALPRGAQLVRRPNCGRYAFSPASSSLAPPPALSQAPFMHTLPECWKPKSSKRQSVVCGPVFLHNNLSAVDQVRPPLARV
jgi:hypothetical protein